MNPVFCSNSVANKKITANNLLRVDRWEDFYLDVIFHLKLALGIFAGAWR
ncbi:hypothetical protein D1BOALGB6SA_6109 [Olavius sp. associated proteobacterium Delta 1]|nr:hypothetical protein D1BOALGB6SA_6109 [Olavius sp. associated proteobacterium Delta 1]